MSRRIRIALALAAFAGAAHAQFDAYTWDLEHGQWGDGQTWVHGDRLSIHLNPACAFGDVDSGWARTVAQETGRFTFDYSATSQACSAFGGFCSGAHLSTVTGACDCPVYSGAPLPDCDFEEAFFNGGSPYFPSIGQVSLSGQWSVDVLAGECFRIAAATSGFSLDCQILATFVNLVFTPALESSQAQLSLGAGGSVGLALTAPQDLASQPYLVLGSASGVQPGIPVDGWVLPLNSDAYLLHTLSNPNAAPISGGFGQLDAGGRAAASFSIAPATSPALAGLQLHHAALVFDLTSSPGPLLSFVSNASALTLVP